LLKLGSVNTVKSYLDYLENSWLFFIINKYAYSIKEQQIAPKKIYGIDTGLTNSVGFNLSKNSGKLMENIVYLHLRKKDQTIYYYKTDQGYEVDFFLPKTNQFIQVSQYFDSSETQERELRAIRAAALEQKKVTTHLVITESDKQVLNINNIPIQVVPLYEWLLK